MGFQVNRIEIYPYGGCSKLEYDINVSLWKEFLVLVMGPFVQILFVFLVSYSKLEIENYFYTYHWIILTFNLLPIYPLDGGRLLYLLLSCFLSYFQCLRRVFYLSFFLYFCFFFYVILFHKNLILLLVFSLLGIKVHKETQLGDYYFQKFLIERYSNFYSFSRIKKVENVKQMRREYYHYFIHRGGILTEKEQLSRYFL